MEYDEEMQPTNKTNTSMYVHLAFDQDHSDVHYYRVEKIEKGMMSLTEHDGKKEVMSITTFRFFHRRNITKEEYEKGPWSD